MNNKITKLFSWCRNCKTERSFDVTDLKGSTLLWCSACGGIVMAANCEAHEEQSSQMELAMAMTPGGLFKLMEEVSERLIGHSGPPKDGERQRLRENLFEFSVSNGMAKLRKIKDSDDDNEGESSDEPGQLF